MAMMNSLKKARIKRKLMLINDSKCCYCRCKVEISENQPNSASIEHIFPQAFQTKLNHIHNINNLLLSCRKCNSERGAQNRFIVELFKQPSKYHVN